MIQPSMNFNSYAVGNKVYNGGSNAPNIMPLGRTLGGAQRKLEVNSRRNALLRRLKAGQSGATMSADWLRSPRA
jgi:hypothetical protein